jgi:hypothetical protein
VALILKMLGQGIPAEEILREYPRLEKVDIYAAMAYAARTVEHKDVFPLPSRGALELAPAWNSWCEERGEDTAAGSD